MFFLNQEKEPERFTKILKRRKILMLENGNEKELHDKRRKFNFVFIELDPEEVKGAPNFT